MSGTGGDIRFIFNAHNGGEFYHPNNSTINGAKNNETC
jgi:hypothetical protein